VRACVDCELEAPGLFLKRPWRGSFTVTDGEILTAERLASISELRLHTRTSNPVRIACRGEARVAIENELRRRGVRVVDEHGAIIAPTLEDFEAGLMRGPDRVRQSSDDALSVLHSFFGWALAEDLIEIDPSAPLRRPKKRRAWKALGCGVQRCFMCAGQTST
jgi:hypothetical protein